MRRHSVLILAAFVLVPSLAIRLGLAARLGLGLRPGIVEAGTAVRLDLHGLVERADLVLEGRVVAERAILGPAKRIDTEYTIAVDHTFFGEAIATRVIRMPGGVMPDGRGMILPGLPRLLCGSSVLLFLTAADPIGMRMPVGLAQGELSIVTDLDGKKKIVREQGDLSLYDPRTGGVAQADTKAFLDYAGTLAEIESCVAAKRARQSSEHASSGARTGQGGASTGPSSTHPNTDGTSPNTGGTSPSPSGPSPSSPSTHTSGPNPSSGGASASASTSPLGASTHTGGR